MEKSITRRACKWAGLCEGVKGRCPWGSDTDLGLWETDWEVSWGQGAVKDDLRGGASDNGPHPEWEGGIKRLSGERSQVMLRRPGILLKSSRKLWMGFGRPITWPDVHFNRIIQATGREMAWSLGRQGWDSSWGLSSGTEDGRGRRVRSRWFERWSEGRICRKNRKITPF